MPFRFVDIQNSANDLALLEDFYHGAYIAGFPDPDERESLANMLRYLQLRSDGWYGQNHYHIVIAKDDDQIIGAAVCDYLADPNVGVIEFLLVSDACRGTGVGRALHDETQRLLERDAETRCSSRLAGIVIEMNDPYRVELRTDNMDPFRRAEIWGKWGYRVLQFPYVQPALSDNQAPVDYLLLCIKPVGMDWNETIPTETVRQIVFGYLKWAMRIDDPSANGLFQQMFSSPIGKPWISVMPLARYIGHDPLLPFDVVPITSDRDPKLRELMQVYFRSFPGGDTAISPDAFARTLRRIGSGQPGLRYHLWGIRHAKDDPLSGIASFYTLSSAGFGGYIALEAPLRGTGRCGLLLARIEEQMVRDQSGIRGWYIECDQESEAATAFERLGFVPVFDNYIQPSLHIFNDELPDESRGPELVLMYKHLSAVTTSRVHTRAQMIADVREIVSKVYGIEDPDSTPTLQSLLT